MSDNRLNEAIDIVRTAGFAVSRPEWGPWTNQTELHARFPHLSDGGFHKRLRAFPGEFPCERSPKGCIRRLRTTPELLAWLSRPIEQGKRRDLSPNQPADRKP